MQPPVKHPVLTLLADLRVPGQIESSERDASPKRRSSDDGNGEDTDDDGPEPSPPPTSRSSVAGTVAMVVVGGVAVWTALAMS